MCSYCTRIYGPNSPLCWVCAGQFVPGSSAFPAGTGVTDSHYWCALCKKVLGEGSPMCNAVCHRKTPNIITSSGPTMGTFPHLRSPEHPLIVNIECAFCHFVFGYNSPMCYRVCTHRFQSIGETISYPVNPVKRKKVY